MGLRRQRHVVLSAAILLLASACSPAASGPAGDPTPGVAGTVRLYTSVTQDTVDAVLEAFHDAHPGVNVELFRAPTGEVDARIAAERREGRIQADVLWATDPLSMQQYDADGLLRAWQPTQAADLPAVYHELRFWGTRLLNVVIVAHRDTEPPPVSWDDLTDAAYRDAVAIADPGFAGSALGTVAYFALTDDYGTDYLRALADNGTTQVQSIGDVITGVAERQFSVGVSLDKSVRDAQEAGSPIELIWPEPGAIALYSPIAVFASTTRAASAEAFVDFVLSIAGQAAIASTGWQPVRPGVPWGPTTGDVVHPDWSTAFTERDELLREYRAIFGG